MKLIKINQESLVVTILFGLMTGVTLSLAFAPYHWWGLQWLAYIWLLTQVFIVKNSRSTILVFVTFVSHYTTSLWWLWISLHVYGGLNALLAVIAVLLLFCFFSIFSVIAIILGQKILSKLNNSALALSWIIPTLLAGSEWCRGWVLSGFPWVVSGYAHTHSPLKWLAPWIGVYGIGFVSIWLCMQMAICLHLLLPHLKSLKSGFSLQPIKSNLRALLPLITASVLIASTWLYTNMTPWTVPIGKAITIAGLQGNIEQSMKFTEAGTQLSYQTYINLLKQANADLIISPESAHPVPLHIIMKDIGTELQSIIRQKKAHYLLGAITEDNPMQYTNSAYLMNENGDWVYRYDKSHLVPFGEYIPDYFQWFIDLLNIPFGEFAAGTPIQTPAKVGSIYIAPNICYEDLFGEAIAQSIASNSKSQREPHILINLTNLGWFGTHTVLDQHLQIGVMRALETQKPIVRVTNSGITSIIHPNGTIISEIARNKTAMLTGQVQGYKGLTPYVRLQNYPILMIWTIVLILGLWQMALTRRQLK